ncbi:hypothetical protein HYU07_07030 [Candidatus Woesearchaeota archaeon]|nr:hypothetical protein [Candidatus Woesearchaeota archaeon]
MANLEDAVIKLENGVINYRKSLERKQKYIKTAPTHTRSYLAAFAKAGIAIVVTGGLILGVVSGIKSCSRSRAIVSPPTYTSSPSYNAPATSSSAKEPIPAETSADAQKSEAHEEYSKTRKETEHWYGWFKKKFENRDPPFWKKGNIDKNETTKMTDKLLNDYTTLEKKADDLGLKDEEVKTHKEALVKEKYLMHESEYESLTRHDDNGQYSPLEKRKGLEELSKSLNKTLSNNKELGINDQKTEDLKEKTEAAYGDYMKWYDKNVIPPKD